MVSVGGRTAAPALDSPSTSTSAAALPDWRLRALFWFVATLFGALQVWAHRFDVAPDGISYIEIAQSGAKDFINGYWSPLYPSLLRLAFRIFPTSLYSESTVVHLANLLISLFSLACFEVFLKELLRLRKASPDFQNGDALFSNRGLWAAGYIFFFWAGHFWVTPAWITPDLLVAGLTYLATAALLRIHREAGNWFPFASFGVILGLAYLAKTPMILLAFVFLACAAWLAQVRKTVNASIALLCFLLVAAPFVFWLSSVKGRLTFGDSGKINYAEFVDGAPKYVHWQGEPPGTGVPAHPTRQILSSPPLYEFSTPVRGSYPPWYDPSYWYEGIKPHLSVEGQLLALYRTASAYIRIFSVTGVLYVVFVPLIFFAKRNQLAFANLGVAKRTWLVWLPAYAALGMYALVHVEARFVGGFLLMLLIGVLARVRLSRSSGPPWLTKLAYSIALAPAIAVLCAVALNISRIASTRSFEQWAVAQALHKIGIPTGSNVGYIGTALDAYWAHLAQVRIVTEIPDSGRASFVQSTVEQQNEIARKFRQVGVTTVLTKSPDVARSSETWQPIPETRYFVWRLEPNSPASGEKRPN